MFFSYTFASIAGVLLLIGIFSLYYYLSFWQARYNSTTCPKQFNQNLYDQVLFLNKQVSRSFFPAMQLLPGTLRYVIHVSYLLNRLLDDIEDIHLNIISLHLKRQLMAIVQEAISSNDFGRRKELLAQLEELLPKRKIQEIPNTEGTALLQHATVLNAVWSLPLPYRTVLTEQVGVMVAGMLKWNARRYRFSTEAMREEYAYAVAGCIGEILLFSCFQAASSGKYQTSMRSLGRGFGIGLQKVNFLRNLWEDWKDLRGPFISNTMCEELDFASPIEMMGDGSNHQAIRAVARRMVDNALPDLDQAKQFIHLIPRRDLGVRLFCLFCWAMALGTLSISADHPDLLTMQGAKLTRRQTRLITLLVMLVGWNNWLITLLGAVLKRGWIRYV